MDIKEAIKRHEEAIELLELINRAQITYRSNYFNASSYKRAGFFSLSEKFNHRTEISKRSIERLKERYKRALTNILS